MINQAGSWPQYPGNTEHDWLHLGKDQQAPMLLLLEKKENKLKLRGGRVESSRR
jgi:hypothetical protein